MSNSANKSIKDDIIKRVNELLEKLIASGRITTGQALEVQSLVMFDSSEEVAEYLLDIMDKKETK